jgi:hypothetical protein
MRIVRSTSQAMAGISVAIALSVSALTASAASTFLLQFGTHESEQAAEQQWQQLREQYGEVLSPLTLRVSEVGGQFRTQAGSLNDRDAARSICSRLGADDVQCLVVETSMYLPETTAADTAYAPLAPVEENISVEMVSEDAMEGVSVEDAGLMPQPQIATATSSAPPAAADAQEGGFASGFLPWLMGDDESPEAAPAAPEAAMEETTESAAEAETPAPQQAPRPERIAEVEQPAWAEPIDRSAAASLSESLPAPATQQAPLSAEEEFDNIISNRDAGPVATANTATPTPVTVTEQPVAETAPVAAPQETAPSPANEPQILRAPKELQPQVSPQAPLPQAVSGQAQVEVAEAIQVPLTFGETAAVPVPANKPVGHGGFPSQPLPARTLWIQLNQFASKDDAMGYWRMLMGQYPEMMRLLRVRIVAPWRSGYGGRPNRASLRVGPFADQAAIDNLCAIAAQSNLRCTTVQEVGSTATANTQRRAASAEMYNRRVATNRAYASTPAGMYWIQLGAFDNVQAAQQFWGNLQNAHNDILGRLQPQISYPAMSSSPTPVYHLRSGPFVSQSSAVGLCNMLQRRHAGCIVIQSR